MASTASTDCHFDHVYSLFTDNFKSSLDKKSIDPLSQKLSPLHQQVSQTPETLGDFKNTIDNAFRRQLIELNDTSTDVQVYENFLNITIQAVKEGFCSASLPVTILGDLFDMKTLPDCEKLFFLVEDRVTEWKSDTFFKNIKNQLLRTCNDLLRRLSRSQNTIFCGRILIFLARFFPLFERSGLNLIGEFNRENTITISQNESEPDTSNDAANNSGDLEEGEMSNEPAFQADYNLYSKFWQLQDFFRQPKICFDRLEWKRFSASSNEVLTVLAQLKLDTQSNSSTLDDISTEGTFFAKYLTNQKLFELQLSDSNFRRYILIQFLIAFQFLTSSVKFHDKVLTDEQKDWVNETTDKVLDLISQTPPRGREMMKAVSQLLQREENWSNWKNDGCPEIKPDEVSTRTIDQSKYIKQENIGAELIAAEKAGKFSLGNKELTRLWNLHPDNWQACKSHKRVFTPTVDEYFESIVRMPKEARTSKICADASFTWRGLRLLSQKSPHFFTPSNLTPRALNVYMESVVETLQSVVNVEPSRNDSVEDTEDISDDDFLRAPEDTNQSNSARASPSGNSSTDTTSNGHQGITKDMLPEFAKKIAHCWKDCAKSFTFGSDEIEYFETLAENCEGRAERMLEVWLEQFPDDADFKILKTKFAKHNISVTL